MVDPTAQLVMLIMLLAVSPTRRETLPEKIRHVTFYLALGHVLGKIVMKTLGY